MHVVGVDHIVVNTQDIERAMHFYHEALGPTDLHHLHAELKAKGVQVEDTVRPAWGAQGYGQQFKLCDPDGNKIELRCYTGSQAV